MEPIIGLFAEVDSELTSAVKRAYVSAIETSGGIPILLPYVESTECLNELLSLCDGFFFTGGVDISPKRYGEDKKSTCGDLQLNRDAHEFAAFEKAFALKKPILAICRGAQLVNVALGGSLYQDIPSELKTDIIHRQTEGMYEYSHEVNIKENTPLFELFESARIRANSFHHQAIKKIGKGLEVMATSDDGIIEAVYYNGEQYLRAYQWHPERLCGKDKYNRGIIDDFIKNCQK